MPSTLPSTKHPYFLAIGGQKEAGKSTFASLFPETHNGQPVLRLEMSRDVHKALWILDPIIPFGDHSTTRYRDYVDYNGLTKAKENPEVRRLLQAIGDGVGRDLINEETWVNLIYEDVHAALSQGQSVILSGVRRPNELGMLDALDSLGHTRSVFLRRITTESIRNPLGSAESHGSEHSLTGEDFDQIVENNGSLDALQAWAEHVLEQHLMGRPQLRTDAPDSFNAPTPEDLS